MRYHGSTLAELPVRTQKVLEVYWLGVRMYLNERYFIANQYTLSPNKVITMADTCSDTTMVHLVRQLGTTHVQEAMNIAAYGGHAQVVRLCYNYDKVDIDEVMEWAVEGGHKEVVRLCQNWKSQTSIRLYYGPQAVVMNP